MIMTHRTALHRTAPHAASGATGQPILPGGLEAILNCSFALDTVAMPGAVWAWARVQTASHGPGFDCYFRPGDYKKHPDQFRKALHAACVAQPVRIAKVVRFKGPYLASARRRSHTLPTENLLEDADGLLRLPLSRGGEGAMQPISELSMRQPAARAFC